MQQSPFSLSAPLPSLQSTQQRINEIQAIYRDWLDLQPKLRQAQADWQKSVDLMAQLEAFYSGGEYQSLYEAMEHRENSEKSGLTLDLTTQGEYSVMSEDAIWNAMGDEQQALWWLLRFAVKHLDKQADE